MKKRALLLVIVFSLSLFSSILTGEVNAGVIEQGYNYRYGYLSNGKYSAKINYDYIESSLASKQNTAISHWNSNASAYVNFQKTSFSNADITVSTVTTTWEPGEDIYGLACLYDNEGKWVSDGYFASDLSPQAPSKPGQIRYVEFCSIMLPNFLDETSSSHQNRVLRHEMGHAIALGHVSTSSALMYALPNPNNPYNTVNNDSVTQSERNKLSSDISNYN